MCIRDSTVTLTGNHSQFTGNTTLAAGVLNVGHSNALGSNSTGTIQFSGGVLQYSADNQVDYSARMSSAANGTIKIDTHGQDVTLATGLSGSGVTLTKLGSGNLTLSGANTYSGDSNINAGTLTVTGGLADSSDVVVASGARYAVQASDTVQSLSGSGSVELAGGVTLPPGGANHPTPPGVTPSP